MHGLWIIVRKIIESCSISSLSIVFQLHLQLIYIPSSLRLTIEFPLYPSPLPLFQPWPKPQPVWIILYVNSFGGVWGSGSLLICGRGAWNIGLGELVCCVVNYILGRFGFFFINFVTKYSWSHLICSELIRLSNFTFIYFKTHTLAFMHTNTHTRSLLTNCESLNLFLPLSLVLYKSLFCHSTALSLP